MRAATLKIGNFRRIRAGFVRFGKHPVLVGDNNTGKTTLIEALTLLSDRDRLVWELTGHDFYGSCPQAADRIKLVVTITDFPNDDPEQSSRWFREGRAVVNGRTKPRARYIRFETIKLGSCAARLLSEPGLTMNHLAWKCSVIFTTMTSLSTHPQRTRKQSYRESSFKS